MSQSLPATDSQLSLNQEQPESSKAPIPPPPLRADTDEFPALDDVLRKKRSNKLFAPLSSKRSRKDSKASSAKLSIANGRLSGRTSDAEAGETGTQEVEVQEEDRIIQLDTPAPVSAKLDKTIFRWAKLYENQRGLTLLGQANYGSRSLLPKIDPTPFTHDLDGQSFEDPEEAEAAMCTPATLRDYLLPDGSWRWVSKTWMVDMDGNGDTCADGWQYNWGFRKKGWRPHPGSLSAGGWVRRRHWLRLMMRPADNNKQHLHPSGSPRFRSDSPLDGGSSSPSLPGSRRNSSATGSRAPGSSIIVTDPRGTSIISALEPDDDDVSTSAYSALGHTWRGDAALDWERCRQVLGHYKRDGKKLELWGEWLGVTHDAEEAHAPAMSEDYLTVKGKGKMEDGVYSTVKAKPKDSEDYLTAKAKGKLKEKHLPDTEDFVESPLDNIDPSALSSDDFFTPRPVFTPPKEYVEAVVRNHLGEILDLFVFPSSRTQLRTMLSKAGFLNEEENDAASAKMPTTPSQPEFWTRRPPSPSPPSSSNGSKRSSPAVSRHTSKKKGKRPASGDSDIDQTKPTSRDHTTYTPAVEDGAGRPVERTDEPGKKKLSVLGGSLHVAATE